LLDLELMQRRAIRRPDDIRPCHVQAQEFVQTDEDSFEQKTPPTRRALCLTTLLAHQRKMATAGSLPFIAARTRGVRWLGSANAWGIYKKAKKPLVLLVER
jgi:hypothetical protein